jgi:hypothetical protein
MNSPEVKSSFSRNSEGQKLDVGNEKRDSTPYQNVVGKKHWRYNGREKHN